MHAAEQNASHYLIAALLSSLVYIVVYVIEQYVLIILFNEYDTGYVSYIYEASLFGIPPFLLALTTAFIVYKVVSKLTKVAECHCRKCGYILKGLSEPKCSECGEVI